MGKMLRDEIAEWIINHCHKTCGREMNVEMETALMEADEILAIIRQPLYRE
jgi:predicted hydrolase (HD superfamily)